MNLMCETTSTDSKEVPTTLTTSWIKSFPTAVWYLFFFFLELCKGQKAFLLYIKLELLRNCISRQIAGLKKKQTSNNTDANESNNDDKLKP